MMSPIPPIAPSVSVTEASLFLDLDGTLAPMADTPGDVRPCGARTSLLRQARERPAGRLAIVSGRTLDSVDAILEGACIAVTGVHGLQRRSAAGDVEMEPPLPQVRRAAGLMAVFARGQPGLLVECKDHSVALHHRGAPGAEAAVAAFVGRLAEAEALEVQPGRMVLELRPPGPDKCAAVRAYMAERPFQGSVPIYVGDDLRDEPAFAEVAARGGLAVLVGPPRPSAATARLEEPAQVLSWIAGSLQRGAFRIGGASA